MTVQPVMRSVQRNFTGQVKHDLKNQNNTEILLRKQQIQPPVLSKIHCFVSSDSSYDTPNFRRGV